MKFVGRIFIILTEKPSYPKRSEGGGVQ